MSRLSHSSVWWVMFLPVLFFLKFENFVFSSRGQPDLCSVVLKISPSLYLRRLLVDTNLLLDSESSVTSGPTVELTSEHSEPRLLGRLGAERIPLTLCHSPEIKNQIRLFTHHYTSFDIVMLFVFYTYMKYFVLYTYRLFVFSKL